jgi:hypothetical protein
MGILVIALIMSVSILIFLIYRYGKLYNKSQELLNISIAQTDDALELVSFYKKSISINNLINHSKKPSSIISFSLF